MQYNQRWPKVGQALPIVIVGAGGIVHDAHLPAYRQVGLPVKAIFDIQKDLAEERAKNWDIPIVANSLEEITNFGTMVVYDLAIPPDVITKTLLQLPDNAAILIQKPMGRDLQTAKQIKNICAQKNLTVAVNFQLRFSPMMLIAHQIIKEGDIGTLLDVEANINVLTPWELFPFLKGMDRLEMLLHSIHYIDLIRSIVGNPTSVFARSVNDPRLDSDLSQTRTSVIFDYPAPLRCLMSINHNHNYGPKFQNGYFRFEGTKGCIIVKVGALLNYPEGAADELWLKIDNHDWQEIPLEGSWFPDAFIGTMSNLQRFYNKEDKQLLTSVDDACQTMAVVEACFQSLNTPGVLPKYS
ncbi:MAG: Gfo/Idh/MocA family protein [Niabella sp.]